MNTLILPAHSLRRLRENGRVDLWLPMAKQPVFIARPKWFGYSGEHVETPDGFYLLAEKSKYLPGDEVAIREAWGTDCLHGYTDELCRESHHEECVKYKADIISDLALMSWEGHWRSASSMPLWAVRTFATVVSVEPRMLGSITANDVENAGFALANETGDKLPDGFNEWMPERRDEYLSSVASEIAGDVAGLMSAFIGQYNRDHPRHPFAPQNWAWRVRMEMKGAGE